MAIRKFLSLVILCVMVAIEGNSRRLGIRLSRVSRLVSRLFRVRSASRVLGTAANAIGESVIDPSQQGTENGCGGQHQEHGIAPAPLVRRRSPYRSSRGTSSSTTSRRRHTRYYSSSKRRRRSGDNSISYQDDIEDYDELKMRLADEYEYYDGEVPQQIFDYLMNSGKAEEDGDDDLPGDEKIKDGDTF